MNRIGFFAIFFTIFVIGCSTETDKQVVAVDSVDGITMPESAAVMKDGGIVISEPHLDEFGAVLGHFCFYLSRAN